jgi:hypothetical protein
MVRGVMIVTDHYINTELCSQCIVRKICSAIVAGGSWNPYGNAQHRPRPGILQKGKVV